jgi:RNA polymerase sigma factor (TIGR02999 family)
MSNFHIGSLFKVGLMTTTSRDKVTQLLLDWRKGDEAALQRLVPLVHKELHRLAHHYMAGESRRLTLQSTVLVNEAYLRLLDCSRVGWQNRAQFFAISAQLMRRVLVDFARSRQADKRGGEACHVELEEAAEVPLSQKTDLVALDEALKALASMDSRKSQIVELRFFGGLSVEETAEVLKVSPRTIKREWSVAQAWLHRELCKT